MQVRSQETRSKILQTAMTLFGQRGYDATGVAEICQTADVSKGAFYHHFSSKQAVFLDLLEDWLKAVQIDLTEAMKGSSSVIEGLLRMATMTRAVFSAADGRLSIFLEFWAQARKDPEVWRRTIEPLRLYRDSFAALIQRGIDDGSFAPVDPRIAAQGLVSIALGIIMQGVFDPLGEQWDRVALEVIKLFINGVGRR